MMFCLIILNGMVDVIQTKKVKLLGVVLFRNCRQGNVSGNIVVFISSGDVRSGDTW